MGTFSLLISIALVGCTFSFPQPVPQGWFSSGVKVGTTAVNGATQVNVDSISTLANSGLGLGQDAIKAGASFLEKGVENGLISEHMQKEVGALVTGLSESGKSLVDKLNEGQGIAENLKGKVDNIVQELGSLANSDSVKLIKENVDSTRKKLEAIKNEIGTVIARSSGKSMGETMKAMSDSIGKILGELGSVVGGDTGEELMFNFGNHVGKAINEVSAVIENNPLQKVTGAISDIKNKLENAVNDLSSTIAEERNRPVGEVIGKVGVKLEGVLGQVGSAIGGTNGQRILGNLGEKVKNVMTEVGSTVEESMQQIGTVADNVEGQLGQAMGQVKSFIGSTNKDDVIQLVKNGPVKALMDKYGGAFAGAAGDAAAATSEGIPDKIGCTIGKTIVSKALPLIIG